MLPEKMAHLPHDRCARGQGLVCGKWSGWRVVKHRASPRLPAAGCALTAPLPGSVPHGFLPGHQGKSKQGIKPL